MHVWPQITYLTLVLVGAGYNIAKYGETKVSKHDWSDFVSTALILIVLYYGGFFSPLGFAP